MNNELEKYISDNLKNGITPSEIKKSLIGAGWNKDDIESHFLNNTNTTGTKTGLKDKLPKNFPSIILRIGIGFVFMYAALFISTDLEKGKKFVPEFVSAIIPLQIFLYMFGGFEILLAIWILSGKFKAYSALIAAFVLISITSLDYTYFSITFRNVAIICACIALAVI